MSAAYVLISLTCVYCVKHLPLLGPPPPFPTPSHGPPLAHKTLNIKLRPQKLASVSVAVSQIQQKNGAQTALDVESRDFRDLDLEHSQRPNF